MTGYNVEMTDTFGGEANYSWVKRCEIEASSELAAVRKAKAELGISGIKCRREDWGDTIVLRPYGACVIVFINADY